MKILGIDPGFRSAGWGMVEHFPPTEGALAQFLPVVLDCNWFCPVPKLPGDATKTSEVQNSIAKLAATMYSIETALGRPDLVVLETYTPSPGWKRGGDGGEEGRGLGSTSYRPAWVEGVCLGFWASRGVECTLVRPNEVRSHFLGAAQRRTKANPDPAEQDRSKEAMESALISRLKLKLLPWGGLAKSKQNHPVDAICVAICGAEKGRR